jgi:hypothetical protein
MAVASILLLAFAASASAETTAAGAQTVAVSPEIVQQDRAFLESAERSASPARPETSTPPSTALPAEQTTQTTEVESTPPSPPRERSATVAAEKRATLRKTVAAENPARIEKPAPAEKTAAQEKTAAPAPIASKAAKPKKSVQREPQTASATEPAVRRDVPAVQTTKSRSSVTSSKMVSREEREPIAEGTAPAPSGVRNVSRTRSAAAPPESEIVEVRLADPVYLEGDRHHGFLHRVFHHKDRDRDEENN